MMSHPVADGRAPGPNCTMQVLAFELASWCALVVVTRLCKYLPAQGQQIIWGRHSVLFANHLLGDAILPAFIAQLTGQSK